MLSPTQFRLSALALLIGTAPHVGAYELYADEDTHLNASIEAAFGVFHSQERYATAGRYGSEGSSSWREGYIKYGLDFDQKLGDAGTGYGAFALISSATWGDGDAAGFTDGSERNTEVEDAYIGWRSGNLIQALGEDGVDISVGRQKIVVGDGFLINGDALNLGQFAGDTYDRGGAYWLAGRKSFNETAVLRLGGTTGWRSDLMHLKSDNRSQANSELFVGTLEHVADAGTIGLTYIDVTDVDEQYASPAQLERDGMKTYSLRAQGNAGVENLFLSGEYAWQDKDNASDEKAWYLEAGWTFSDVAWSPTVTYRYSRFSETYDPLFYGFNRGYGTWFQGEVAANYAGPFNSNTRVHHLGLRATPLENLAVGALWFDFDSLDKDLGDTSGRELNLYAEWGATQNLVVMPVIGFYKPEQSADTGGLQLGNNDRNLYSQLVFAVAF